MVKEVKGILISKGKKYAIVVSRFNEFISSKLLGGAIDALTRHGVKDDEIKVYWVPGAFEIPYAAGRVAAKKGVDAIICLGAVIRGATPHFDYICSGVTQGMSAMNVQYGIPFIFGLLTNNTMQQSIDRAGGVLGNKGDEAAVTAIKMIALNKEMSAAGLA